MTSRVFYFRCNSFVCWLYFCTVECVDYCRWIQSEQRCVANDVQMYQSLSQSQNLYANIWACEFIPKNQTICSTQKQCKWDSSNNICMINYYQLLNHLENCLDFKDPYCLQLIDHFKWIDYSIPKNRGSCQEKAQILSRQKKPCKFQWINPKKNNMFCSTIKDIAQCFSNSGESLSEKCQHCYTSYENQSICYTDCAGYQNQIDRILMKLQDSGKGIQIIYNYKKWNPISDETLAKHFFSDIQTHQSYVFRTLMECNNQDNYQACIAWNHKHYLDFTNPENMHTSPKQEGGFSIFQSWSIYFIIIGGVIFFAGVKGLCLSLVRRYHMQQQLLQQQRQMLQYRGGPGQEMEGVQITNQNNSELLEQKIRELQCTPYEFFQQCDENQNLENIDSNQVDECVICQLIFVHSQSIVELSCQHYFHKDCIIQWIKAKGIHVKCPLCAANVFSNYDIGDGDGDAGRNQNEVESL